MTKLSTLLAASAAAGALVLTGCGNSDDAQQTDDAQPTTQAEDTEPADDADDDEAAADEKGGSLEAAQAAINLAEKEIDGKAIEIDFDDEKTWELTVLKGSEEHEVEVYPEGKTDSVDIYVSAMNGEIVDEPEDD